MTSTSEGTGGHAALRVIAAYLSFGIVDLMATVASIAFVTSTETPTESIGSSLAEMVGYALTNSWVLGLSTIGAIAIAAKAALIGTAITRASQPMRVPTLWLLLGIAGAIARLATFGTAVGFSVYAGRGPLERFARYTEATSASGAISLLAWGVVEIVIVVVAFAVAIRRARSTRDESAALEPVSASSAIRLSR